MNLQEQKYIAVTTLVPIQKRLQKKGKKNVNTPEYSYTREFKISTIIPRNISLKQYFRTKQNIQFALTTFNENTLGELGVNIFSIGYSVVKTEISKEKLEYSLQARDLESADIETIFRLLEVLQLENARINLQKYLEKYEQISFIPKSTPEEVQKMEDYAAQYPYECYTYRYQNGESSILKYTHNLKFLYLMGITVEMLEQYLSEAKILPCAIHVQNYLEIWQKVFGAVSNDSSMMDIELQNFNGNKLYVNIQQVQFFVQEGENLYGFLYWIYLIEPNQRLALENADRELEKLNPKPKQCTYKTI